MNLLRRAWCVCVVIGCGTSTPDPEEPAADHGSTPPTSTAAAPSAKEIESAAPSAPAFPSDALNVEITKTAVTVDGRPAADLPAQGKQAAGFDASKKAHGPTDMVIRPLSDAVKASKSPGKAAALVTAEGSAAYRIFFEVIYTLQQGDVRAFELRLASDPSKRVPVRVRRLARLVDDAEKQLDLTVLMRPEGFTLTTSQGPIGGGCAVGSGVTLPRAAGAAIDMAGLLACARKLKTQTAGALERSVTIRAAAGTPMAEVFEAASGIAVVFPIIELGS